MFAAAIRTRNRVLKALSILADEVKFVDDSSMAPTFCSNDTFDGSVSIAGVTTTKHDTTFVFKLNWFPFPVITEQSSPEIQWIYHEIHAPRISPTTVNFRLFCFRLVLFRSFLTRSKNALVSYSCHSLDTGGLYLFDLPPGWFSKRMLYLGHLTFKRVLSTAFVC